MSPLFPESAPDGKRYDGTTLDHAMPLFTHLTDEEVNAIYTYLRTAPVIDREINQ